MSTQVQFVVDVEIEDDDIDIGDVDILDIQLDGLPENVEFSWAARRTGE